MAKEQVCGFRKSGSLIPLRHAQGNFDIVVRLKAILIRRDVYKHLIGVFSKFEDDIKAFIELDWYNQFHEREPEAEGVADLPEDDDVSKVDVSTFVSKIPLTKLCTKLAKGHFELSMCKIATLGLQAKVCEADSQ